MGLIGDVLIAVAIAVGLVGIIVPVLPGTVLILAAIVVWAIVEGGAAAWTSCAIAVAILGAAQALKYAVPGRRLQVHGVPASTLAAAGVLAIVGFFVIPVVGLVVGFVAGVYLAEVARLRNARRAMASTAAAVRAVGLAIAIELVGGLLAAAAWLVGVIAAA
jgi:uncharacterized protein YqgC (DUF456 family)